MNDHSATVIEKAVFIGFLGGMMTFWVLFYWASQYKLPSEQFFERTAEKTGIYRESLPGRHSGTSGTSYVNNQLIYCGSVGFFSRSEAKCHFPVPDLQKIVFTEAIVPTYLGAQAVVIEAASPLRNQRFITLSNAQIKEMWWKNTYLSCVIGGIFTAFLCVLIYLIYGASRISSLAKLA
jgi:hypothetical protein